MRFMIDARFVPGADREPAQAEETQRVAELREKGVFVQVFRRIDDGGAFVIAEAPSAKELEEHLDLLPFVIGGIMGMTCLEIEEV